MRRMSPDLLSQAAPCMAAGLGCQHTPAAFLQQSAASSGAPEQRHVCTQVQHCF